MQWNNVQFLFFNPPYLGNTTFGVNGPDYHVKGLEAQFQALLMEGLTLSGSGSYNDDTQAGSPCLVEQYRRLADLWPVHHPDHSQGLDRPCSLSSIRSARRARCPAFSPRFQGKRASAL